MSRVLSVRALVWSMVILGVAWLIYDETRNSGDELELPSNSSPEFSADVDPEQATEENALPLIGVRG